MLYSYIYEEGLMKQIKHYDVKKLVDHVEKYGVFIPDNPNLTLPNLPTYPKPFTIPVHDANSTNLLIPLVKTERRYLSMSVD